MSDQEKSTFVTVTAWIFIVLSGFMTLISIPQNIAIQFLFPKEEMVEAIQQSKDEGSMGTIHAAMFEYFEFFFLAFLIISLFTFIASVGLLNRKNWARIIFIILMSFGIVWNIGGTIFMFLIFDSFLPEGQDVPSEFILFQNLITDFNILFVLAMSALFAWIIRKLTHAAIREEFL